MIKGNMPLRWNACFQIGDPLPSLARKMLVGVSKSHTSLPSKAMFCFLPTLILSPPSSNILKILTLNFLFIIVSLSSED